VLRLDSRAAFPSFPFSPPLPVAVVAMAAAEASALDIQLHPLIVLSLADHYTRERVSRGASARCVGLLFGQQAGRTVKVLETVEMAFHTEEAQPDQPILEQEAVETDMQLFSEAYPNYECLGWYSSGSAIRPHDYVLQKQLTKYNERPLFLLLDPAATNGKTLPLTVYEERTHVVGDHTSSEFVRAEYTVQADEAERITVTHCAKVVNQEETGSAAVSHYTTMIKATESLKARVAAVHAFLADVQAGKISLAHGQQQQILRDIKGLCHRLPVMAEDKFRSDLLGEYNDALLVTYLSSMTKGSQLLADVQEKFNVVHAAAEREDPRDIEGGRRRRGPGGGMDDDFGRQMRRGGAGGFMSDLMSGFGMMG